MTSSDGCRYSKSGNLFAVYVAINATVGAVKDISIDGLVDWMAI